MKTFIKRIGKEAALFARIAIVSLVVIGGVVYAQTTFVQPSQNPPGGNVAAPVHVGGTAQAKAGSFAANALAGQWVQGTTGFCIGPNSSTGSDANCITNWPSGGGGASSIYIHEQTVYSGTRNFPARVDCPAGWIRTGCSGGIDTTSKRDVHAVPVGTRGCQMRVDRNRQGNVWAHCIRLADEPQTSPAPAPTPPPDYYGDEEETFGDSYLRLNTP